MTQKYRYTIILDDEERAMLNFLTNKGLYTYKTVLRLAIRGRYYSETQKLKQQGINVILNDYIPVEEVEQNNGSEIDEVAELERLKELRRQKQKGSDLDA